MDSRPSIGFPLGTALLIMVIFTLTAIFSCCYHWDKLRRSHSAADGGCDLGPSNMDLKQKHEKQSLPVIMPGDNVPKFIALPCPCQPPGLETIIVDVQKPPPPRMAVPLH